MPVIIVAEIGINHQGSLETALKLIDAAQSAGADMVKFQKRVPELSVPVSQREAMKETPWGIMQYLAYKKRMEFGKAEYFGIARHCRMMKIPWFASVWDIPSLRFIEAFDTSYIKIPSAMATNDELLKEATASGKPTILSTGMCDPEMVRHAVSILNPAYLLHCTSTYPCPPAELNLKVVTAYKEMFPWTKIGYSGHETGLAPTLAAVAMGATMVERHITLDRASWGTDQAASVEPSGFRRLVKDIRLIESALGDGVKKIEPGEQGQIRRLRG